MKGGRVMELTVFDLTSRARHAAAPERSAPRDETDADAYEHTLEQAGMADEGGLDAYYLTEHHSNPSLQIVPSPHLVVAALSQRTARIRLGVMCTNLTLHHPVRVAEEVRMMDLLTSGRLEMGFGRGAAPHEQVGFGVEPSEAETLFEQSLAIVRQLLTSGRLDSYDGGPWKGTGVMLVPEATQRPHPPLWMAAVSDRSLRGAARLGLNLCTAFLDLEGMLSSRKIYQATWADAHPDLGCGRYGTLQHVFVGETEEEAYEQAGPQIEGWLGADVTLKEAIARGSVVCGAPEQCVHQLLLRSEAGIDMFQGWFQFGALDPAASNRSLRLFCQEVAPAVRSALGHPGSAV